MTETLYTGFVAGIPVAKARPRFTKTGRTYTPQKTKTWENTIRAFVLASFFKAQTDKPVGVQLQFNMPRPKSAPKGRIYPQAKPDLDNLEKAVLDALNGVVWLDDAQVVNKYAAKVYGARPGVHIVVTEVV